MTKELGNTMIEKGKIREFTKEDWYGFAGAAEFVDGQPLIYEEEIGDGEFYAIADLTGIEFHLFCDGEDKAWGIEIPGKKRKAKRVLLESLLEELGLDGEPTEEELEDRLNNLDGVDSI